MISVFIERNFADWRMKARELLAQKIPPSEVQWKTEMDMFGMLDALEMKNTKANLVISKDFFKIAEIVSCYRNDEIWPLLYKIAWRIINEERDLLFISLDPDIKRLNEIKKLITRDIHKMHAFVRFREQILEDGESLFIAWHRPDHRITKLVAPFFKDRFNGMKWIIMTSDETIMWDKRNLYYSEGVEEYELPDDEKEDLWKTYYSSIFNPARIKVQAMKKELPVRYWKTLPESNLISNLLDEAPERVEAFYQTQTPTTKRDYQSLNDLYSSLRNCTECGLCTYENSPVFTTEINHKKIVVLYDHPHIENQNIKNILIKNQFSSEEIHTTYAIKNSPSPTRRIKQNEISLCKSWVQNELLLIKPDILICIGKIAYQVVFGKMENKYETKLGPSVYANKTVMLNDPEELLSYIHELVI